MTRTSLLKSGHTPTPSILGAAKDATGTYAWGLVVLALVFAAGTFVLLELGVRWRSRWAEGAVAQSGIFNYRSKIGGDVAEREKGRAA